jgi:hypothetical protein
VSWRFTPRNALAAAFSRTHTGDDPRTSEQSSTNVRLELSHRLVAGPLASAASMRGESPVHRSRIGCRRRTTDPRPRTRRAGETSDPTIRGAISLGLAVVCAASARAVAARSPPLPLTVAICNVPCPNPTDRTSPAAFTTAEDIMLRITGARPGTTRTLPRHTRLRMALALPVLAPIAVAVTAVESITLSRPQSGDVVAQFAPVTGTVKLDGPVIGGNTVVDLSSSNPSVATVPRSVVVARGGVQATFPVTPGAVGCTRISGRIGSTPPKSALFSVRSMLPHPNLELTLSTEAVLAAQSLSGTVTRTNSLSAPFAEATVSLSSSDPAVIVPATIVIPQGSVSAKFPITAASVASSTCSVIRATMGNVETRQLLKVLVDPIPW